MVLTGHRHQIAGHEQRGGDATPTTRRGATPTLVLSLAEVHPSGFGFVEAGIGSSAWSTPRTGRSLSAEVLSHGIGGTVLA